MTLSEIMAHTSALLTVAGEVKIPPKEVYIPLLHQSMLEIANNTYVLGLVTKSENFRVLREIDDGSYIRMPKAPKIDTDKIDIDEELNYALSNYVASKIARKKQNKEKFEFDGMEIQSAYDFKIYRTLELREESECDT